MIDTLSPEARVSAERFISRFDRPTKLRGEEYFANHRVRGLAPSGNASWKALVAGRGGEYAVEISYDGSWSGDCECPMETRCKHVYATMKSMLLEDVPVLETPLGLIAKQPAAAGVPAPASDLNFPELIARKLDRKLTAYEKKKTELLQQWHRDNPGPLLVGESILRDFADVLRSWNHGAHKIWPARPGTVWEGWLFLANRLSAMGLKWPAFLAEITAVEEVDAAVATFVRQEDLERWRRFLAQVQAEKPVLKGDPMHLRAVVDIEAVRLEFRLEHQETWSELKKSYHELYLRRGFGPEYHLAGESEPILWAAFHKNGAGLPTLKYADPQALSALQELFRNPLLNSHLVTPGGTILERPPEMLRWTAVEPEDEAGDYRLYLVRADGSTPPEPLTVLDGKPPLYVAPDAVYRVPPLCRLQANPAKPNVIPAEALETTAGITLLERIGAPFPERIVNRLREVKPRTIVEGVIRSRGGEESLHLEGRAEWPDSAPTEVYTPNGWEREGGQKPASPSPAAGGELVQRDRKVMDAIPDTIRRIGASWSYEQEIWHRRVDRNFAPQFSDWLTKLPAGLDLRLSPELASLNSAPVEAGFRLKVEPTGVDWFDVRTVLDVADLEFSPAELKALLDAKGGWVRLGEKGWRRLAMKWSEQDEENLADLGLSSADLSSEPQKLHALQLAGEKARVLMPTADYEVVRRRADEIRMGVNPAVPATIKADLRPYQVEGFHFLAYLATNRFGGVLADDMGLGKTLQTLTWLAWVREQQKEKRLPSLVVCPKSVTSNWCTEAERFLPGLKVCVWGKGDANALESALQEADLLVINYTQLRLLGDLLAGQQWQAVILDEAQAIKNPDSQTAKSACALNAEYRLALSGTPVENRLMDLWSILAFAMPGVLGARGRFATLYDRADDPFARRRLAARVRPFLLRRTKDQVAKDLPPRTEEDVLCEFEGKQDTLYKAELKRIRQMLLKIKSPKELDKHRFNILTGLLRLRQICCHPALLDAKDAKSGSAKLDALVEMLDPLMQEGHKVLVFSQFLGALDLIREEISVREWKHFVLTGETENRGEMVRDFQATEGGAVFLLSLKAGGAGLNLTAASYVVIFDPWWNPAVENQAIDRTHRIGQTQHVNAYRFLMRNSIEEKIRALQKTKKALADDILGEEAFAGTLSLDDLRFLFEPGQDAAE